MLGSAGAHELRDPLKAAPAGPAAGAVAERLAGKLHRVTIDDRVAGAVLDYQTLTLDDGRALVLRGAAVRRLETGTRVEALGEVNGKALFVHSVRELAPAPSRANGKARAAEVEGTVALLHADYFDEARSQFIAEVEQEGGARTRIDFPVVPEALRVGARVRVGGATSVDGAGIVPDTVTILAAPPSTASAKAVIEKAVRTNGVLVILMTFTDSGATPFTPAQVQGVMSGGPGSGSVAEYFKEVSFGQQLMAATVTPWLPTNAATPAGCNYTQMGSLGRTAATAAGYNPAAYQNVVYVFPAVAACGWIGLAYVGASGVWINGRNATSAYGHELGHNLGLLHAGSVRCSAGAIGGSCTVDEYGDPFDIMGNQSAMHVNAAQKADLGWIAASSVVNHPAGTSTYVLSPIESAGGTTYAVKVAAAANRTYWLEYRQPIGFDAGLASYPNNGAQIRVATPFETLCGGCDAFSNDTQLLDMTPATGSLGDAALLAGKSFVDSTYAININVLAASASGLTVQITTPGGTTGAPTATALASSANPSVSGSPVVFTATVTGSAPTGFVTFKDNGATLANCGAVPVTGSGNVLSAACTASGLAVGAHGVVASYTGDAANASSTSTTLTQNVNPGPFANGGFEAPAVGTYQYRPPGATWVFASSAGITANNSGFTSGNPAAPEGAQVAFLQNVASVSQSVSLAAGQYAVSLKAAQRGNWQSGAQVVVVQIDGTVVGRYEPAGIAYGTYQTAPFTVATGGNHTITLAGGGTGTDYTAFVDDVRIVTSSSTASTTLIASSANPSVEGATVTFTATVTGAAPKGTVTFVDGATAIAGCANVAVTSTSTTAGTATCATAGLGAGAHALAANYAGDAANSPSSSAPLSQVVNAGPVLNAGFEAPVTATYVYRPVGASWVFAGGAGVSANGSGFTSGNPSAPDGRQVGFLQNVASAMQTLNLAAGQYTVSFRAAQRANWQSGSQVVVVQMDGITVGQYQPPGTSYSAYRSAVFTVAATGAHTLTLSGGGTGTDRTAFIDSVLVVPVAPAPLAHAPGPRSGTPAERGFAPGRRLAHR